MTSNKPTKRNREQAYDEIVAKTYDAAQIQQIDEVLWNRISDAKGVQWRHGYKSMKLLEVLLVRGSDAFVANALDHVRRLYSMVNYRAKDKAAAVQLKLVSAFTSGYDGDEKGRGEKVRSTAVCVLKMLHETSKLRILRSRMLQKGTLINSTHNNSLRRLSVDLKNISSDYIPENNGVSSERERMRREIAEAKKKAEKKKKKGLKKVGYVLKKGAKGGVKTVGRVGKMGVKGVKATVRNANKLAGRMRWSSQEEENEKWMEDDRNGVHDYEDSGTMIATFRELHGLVCPSNMNALAPATQRTRHPAIETKVQRKRSNTPPDPPPLLSSSSSSSSSSSPAPAPPPLQSINEDLLGLLQVVSSRDAESQKDEKSSAFDTDMFAFAEQPSSGSTFEDDGENGFDNANPVFEDTTDSQEMAAGTQHFATLDDDAFESSTCTNFNDNSTAETADDFASFDVGNVEADSGFATLDDNAFDDFSGTDSSSMSFESRAKQNGVHSDLADLF